MEYSIQQLSRLAGVSTRTLRWYDQTGLLKPCRTAESGYRYYGPAQVDRLQDILFYRALGVELAQIKRSLDDPSFDRVEALRSHLTALVARKEQLQGMIDCVKQTIHAQEGTDIMKDQEKFQAFKQRTVDENEKRYGAEVREKYGDEQMDRANKAVMGLTQEQYKEWDGLGKEILAKLAAAVSAGDDPAGETGRALTLLHRRWLTITGNTYDPSMHKGLAEMYVADGRFAAYYDGQVAGCAQFLRDAVVHWAE